MTTQPAAQASSLGDIRLKYPQDARTQDYALTFHLPVKFSARVANEVNGWAHKNFTEADIQAVDVAIILLRHLFALIAPEYRQEDTNPFAKMIWADLGTAKSRNEQSRERARILMAFSEQPETRDLKINAWNILENRLMWETIWDMKAFQLWDSTVLSRPADGEDWEETACEPGSMLGRYSAVCYWGDGDVGEVVSKEFGPVLSTTKNMTYHWAAGPHVVMRVIYDATIPEAKEKRFSELCEIEVNPSHLTEYGPEDYRVDPEHTIHYGLVAVIRIRKDEDPDSRDLLRMYNSAGLHQILPTINQEMVGDHDWQLGDLGWKYMLYYTPGRAVLDVPEFRREFILTDVDLDYRMMRASIDAREPEAASTPAMAPPPPPAAAPTPGPGPASTSGFLRPPPTEPRKMREQRAKGGRS